MLASIKIAVIYSIILSVTSSGNSLSLMIFSLSWAENYINVSSLFQLFCHINVAPAPTAITAKPMPVAAASPAPKKTPPAATPPTPAAI